MKTMFANLTRADFGWRKDTHTPAARRRRVHALFDEIQIAIYTGDAARADCLLAELARATARLALAST